MPFDPRPKRSSPQAHPAPRRPLASRQPQPGLERHNEPLRTPLTPLPEDENPDESLTMFSNEMLVAAAIHQLTERSSSQRGQPRQRMSIPAEYLKGLLNS